MLTPTDLYPLDRVHNTTLNFVISLKMNVGFSLIHKIYIVYGHRVTRVEMKGLISEPGAGIF